MRLTSKLARFLDKKVLRALTDLRHSFHFPPDLLVGQVQVRTREYDRDGVRVLLEVEVVHVVVLDRVGVVVGSVPLLQTLLDVGDAPGRDEEVGREDHQHDGLHPALVQRPADVIPERRLG